MLSSLSAYTQVLTTFWSVFIGVALVLDALMPPAKGYPSRIFIR